ncbi:MAG: DUF3800 domain-containing protein [Alphaproteobacteria bacterium]
MIKVYMDESGIHDDSPVVSVGAYLARPKEWGEFTKKWKCAIRPIKCYHATDAANLRGEFKGWKTEDVTEIVKRALPIIPQYTAMGFAVAINLNDLKQAMNGKRGLLKVLGSPYRACLLWTIALIMAEKNKNESMERIAFYHEINNMREDALKVYDHVHNTMNPNSSIMSFSFGAKKDYPPLQAADVLAYEANKRLRNIAASNRRAFDALKPNSGKFVLKYYDQSNMDFLIGELEKLPKYQSPRPSSHAKA